MSTTRQVRGRAPGLLNRLAVALVLAGAALPSDVGQAAPWASPYRTPYPEPPRATAATYAGPFDAAPVPHFVVPLPTEPGRTARTERARPAVAQGAVLVGSSTSRALWMLDRSGGARIRSFPAAASVEAEPLVVGDRVYFGDTGGRVWAYTLGGERLWSYDTKAPLVVRPTLHDGRILVTNLEDIVYALDAASGQMIWRFAHRADVTRRAELALYAKPAVAADGDELYVGFSDGVFMALSATTGDPRWLLPVGEGRYPDLVAEPTIFDDLVFVSGYFEPLLAVHREQHEVVWSLPHGAADKATIVDTSRGPLLLHPGTDGQLRAIEPRLGEIVWTWDSGDSGALTMPVATDLGVVVASNTGTVTILDPTSGRPVWRYAPPLLLDGVGSAPVVDGRQMLFVTNAGRLYSMLSPGRNEPWPPQAP